ncbi:UNVERIFIED_ORG: metal-responsive CopG/Arc/MetJ family transcriptional regulator [Sphingomonas sp. 1057]
MAKSISDNKKSRGRPVTTGTGQMIGVRIQPEQLAEIDRWAATQADTPTRPEAIRRLLTAGLQRYEQ